MKGRIIQILHHSFRVEYIQRIRQPGWSIGKQARLANRVSLGAPFIRPCATSKQKA